MSAPSWLRVLETWSIDPGLSLTLVACGCGYLYGVRRSTHRVRRPHPASRSTHGVRRTHPASRSTHGVRRGTRAEHAPRRRWPRRRTAAFLAGLAAIALALESGLDGYAEQMLSIHMVQHLVLILVAAPLLLAGAPLTLALRTLTPGPRQAVARVLRGRTIAALSHPATGLAALGAVMLATHLTPLFELALTDPTIHVVEHMLYLASGLLFWSVLIAPGPRTRVLDGLGEVVYLLLGTPLMSVVGVILETDGVPRYEAYVAPARRLGISALGDQRLAGALMWVAGTTVMGVIALSVAWRSIVAEERRAVARESYVDQAERTAEPQAGSEALA
ncbi:MAG TPA: cytochrome c oxidase assembly protein [Solirubrobacteraceae bacterium]|nr:cytochrome c oxidase assembly protein [Solirubrobacteraceae bacterium]